MLDKILLDKLAEVPVPHIEAGQCLRSRNKVSSCSRCVEACTHGAVTLSPMVRIDRQRCMGCNLCAGTCPTGAFRRANDSPADLASRIRQLLQPTLTCQRNADHGNVVLGCLASLSPELLAALVLAARGPALNLNLSGCSDCSSGRTLPLIENLIRDAESIVGSIGQSGRMRRVNRNEDLSTTDRTGPAVSRRQLFGLFGKGTGKAVSGTMDSWFRAPRQFQYHRLLPEDRAVLLQELRVIYSVGGSGVSLDSGFWTDWEIGHGCTGCGLCSTLCPTGAWQIRVCEGVQELGFRVSHCVSCGLCSETCPERQIRPRSSANLDDILADRIRVEKAHVLTICARCGRNFVAQDGQSACRQCEADERFGEAVWRTLSTD